MLFDDDADFDDFDDFDDDDDRFFFVEEEKARAGAVPLEVGPVSEILLVREVRVDRNRRSGEEQRWKKTLERRKEETTTDK